MSLLSRIVPWGRSHSHGLDPAVRTLRGAASDAQKSRLPQMAAALSYRTIFGLLPIAALALVVLHAFAKPEQVSTIIKKLISVMGLDKIVIDQATVAASDASVKATAAASDAVAKTTEFVGPLPEKVASLDDWINGLILRLNEINFQAIGAVGIVLLLYAAISMIVEVEARAFNQIYRVPRGRSWTRRLTNYTTLLVYSPICIFLTFYLGQQLDSWQKGFENHATLSSISTLLATIIGVSQVIVTSLLLLVLYTVVPNTKVRLWPAICGALVGAVLFEGLKWGFVQYVDLSAKVSYARLYGSLALIPLFLLWVYITWNVVLFGLQVTYQLQHARFRTSAQPISDFGPTMVEPAAGLVVMNHVARAFAAGTPQTMREIAGGTGINEGAVQMIVPRLAERGLLVRIEREASGGPVDAEPAYVLARSPAMIRVSEILTIGFDLCGTSSGLSGPPSTLMDRMRQAQIDAAGSQTLDQSAGVSPSLAVGLPLAEATGQKTPILPSVQVFAQRS